MPEGLLDEWVFGIFDGLSEFLQRKKSETTPLAFKGSHSLSNSEPLIPIDPIELLKKALGYNDWKKHRFRETMTGETKIGNPNSFWTSHHHPEFYSWGKKETET